MDCTKLVSNFLCKHPMGRVTALYSITIILQLMFNENQEDVL